MRRTVALSLTIALLLTLTACGTAETRRVKSPVDFQIAEQTKLEEERALEIQEAMLRREQNKANRRSSAVERESLPEWPIHVPNYLVKNNGWSLWNWFAQRYPAVQGAESLEEALQQFCAWRGINRENFSLIYKTLDGEEFYEHRPDVPYLAASSIKFPAAFMIYDLMDKGEILLAQPVTYDEERHWESSIGDLATIKQGDTYTFGELLKYMITQSDNISINMMYDYLERYVPPYTKGRQRLADRFGLEHILDENRITAAEFASIMEEFIEEGPKNPYLGLLAEHMKQAAFHEFCTAYIPQNVDVMHKYGDLYEYHNDVGIVLTEDRPYYFIFLSKGLDNVLQDLPDIGLLLYCWNQRGSEFNYGIESPKIQISEKW